MIEDIDPDHEQYDPQKNQPKEKIRLENIDPDHEQDDPQKNQPEGVGPKKMENHVERANKVYNIQADQVITEASEATSTKIGDRIKPLRGRSPHIRHARFDLVGRGWGGCEDHAIVFFTSYDYVASLDVAYDVIERHFEDCEQFYLDFGNQDDVSILALSEAENRSLKSRAILVELSGPNQFLDSIKQAAVTQTNDLMQWLTEQRTTILCATSDKLFDQAEVKQAKSWSAFQHFRIPFLDYVLEDVFGAHEAREVRERLRSQRDEGRWPRQEDEFLKWLNRLWEKGTEVLRHEIDLRSSEEGLDQAEPVKPVDILPEELGIHQIVIWAATYFEDLSVRDFESIVLKLLEGEVIEVKQTKFIKKERTQDKVENKSNKEKNNNDEDEGESEEPGTEKKEEIQELKYQKLTDIWNRGPDAVLRQCELKQLPRSNGRKVIDFSFPYLREQIRKHIERDHPMLSARIFDKLQNLNILLDPNLSDDVIAILIRLAVERTLQDQYFYDEKWFLHTVMDMTNFVSVTFNPEDDDREKFFKVVASLHGQQIWILFCRRLSELIREMLRHDALENTVDRFLKMLLHIGGHHAILDIVLHITGNLRYVHNFDSLYWMKLLLDQGREEIRTQTYGVLHRLALGSGPRVYDFLAGVRDWLPDKDRDPRLYSLAQRMALQFIMVFALGTSQRYRIANLGQWPSDYMLFRVLERDKEKTAEHLELLLSWMHHPGLPSVVSQEVDDPLVSHHESVADVVESWIWILEGIRPSAEADAEAVALSDEVLLCLHRHAGRTERRIVEKRWNARQRLYLECLNSIPLRNRSRRLDFKAKRLKIIEIKKRFRILKESHSEAKAA